MANPEHVEFARRLHEKMRGEKLRVWFASEDVQGKVAITAPRDEPNACQRDVKHSARHAER